MVEGPYTSVKKCRHTKPCLPDAASFQGKCGWREEEEREEGSVGDGGGDSGNGVERRKRRRRRSRRRRRRGGNRVNDTEQYCVYVCVTKMSDSLCS